MGYPADREIIECISQQRRLKRTLRELTDRHLLVRTRAGDEDTYSAHAIVCTYYYDLPNRRELRGMHQRAAVYYEEGLTENFQAAAHFERAGDYLKSADLISHDVWGLMTQGQVSALNLLLTRLTTHWHRHIPVAGPEAEAHVDVHIAHGQVCRFLGDIDAAEAHYQTALEKLHQLPNATDRSERKAQVALGMGEALRDKAPEIALEWLERGLAELFESQSSDCLLYTSPSPRDS